MSKALFSILVMSLLAGALPVYGQQEAMFSQYMFNGLVINPAYAGSQEVLSLTASVRKQWIGIQGAPFTQTFSAHTPLKKEKIALGMLINNDNIGVTHQYGMSGVFAYRVSFSEDKKLSIGLQPGIYQVKSNFSSLYTKNDGDPSFSSDQVSKIIPFFSAGIYYKTAKYYLGFSIPYLTNNLFKDASMSTNILYRKHYFLTGGYVFTLSPVLKLKPSFLLKSSEGSPLQLDLNTNLLLKEVLWMGVSYRSTSTINFLMQFQLTDQFRIGYSYDQGINNLGAINRGSHEFILNYNFSFIKYKVVTPRYF